MRLHALLIATLFILAACAAPPADTAPAEEPIPTPAAEPSQDVAADEPAETPVNDTEEEESLRDEPAPAVRTVQVEAFQFGFDPDPIRANLGEPIRLVLTSRDVAHGIALPEFGISAQIQPGQETVVEFTPDKTGEFTYRCNVYCGQGHGSMTGTLIVE